MKCGMVGEVYC